MPEPPKGFRIPTQAGGVPADPLKLFYSLKRAPNINHPYGHQTGLLNEYHSKHLEEKNVALELPTGSGKTLVGLLIAEWRRRRYKERVVYLCPTRQLCHQVGTHAASYGIKTHVLVGRGADYPPDQLSDYRSAAAIAVTTYSGLFNYKPRITEPKTILLDDAHAAEGFVPPAWTVSIRRTKYIELYKAIMSLMQEGIPSGIKVLLERQEYESGVLYSIPYWTFLKQSEALYELMEEKVSNKEVDDRIVFPWLEIRGSLHACHLYFSWSEIAIRPIIPPTKANEEFAAARQRIYMSATLGEGGELERIFGVPEIKRIPMPPGWDQQSTGRRLLLFPDRSLGEEDKMSLRTRAIKRAGRALILCPRESMVNSMGMEFAIDLPQHSIIRADDIEQSLAPFTAQKKAILLLAARYDGIDLPDDACRMLVVHHLPAGINLQERFLWERLGANALLNGRIATRLSQAVGRCSRNSNDYSVVLLEGEALFDFCNKRDAVQGLHPELQAELELGLDNSADQRIDDFLHKIDLFLRQSAELDDLEQALQDLAEQKDKVATPATQRLQQVVKSEIAYASAMWSKSYERAAEMAKKVSDQLDGEALATYRAWWLYLQGCALYATYHETGSPSALEGTKTAVNLAKVANDMQTWYVEAQLRLGGSPTTDSSLPLAHLEVIERVAARLRGLGSAGGRFQKAASELQKQIDSDEAHHFERGLSELGKLLGWEATQPSGNGTPDGIWICAENGLVFEAKTDEGAAGAISKATTLQAAGHINWIKENLATVPKQLDLVVISPRGKLDNSAVPHAKAQYHLTPYALRSLTTRVISALRTIRSATSQSDADGFKRKIYEVFKRDQLLPDMLLQSLLTTPVLALPRAN
jgi:hypothetical protein